MIAPFFSIVVPTFNSAKTLAICIDSILCQTFRNVEIIIVDGLSTDETLNIIKSYQSAFIKWISEKDGGIYDAMNKGITMANGEWLYFLGSDDRIHDKHVLENIYKLDKGKAYVVYGNAKIIGDTAWSKDGEIYDGEFTLDKLLRKNICHQAIFYSRIFISNSSTLYNTKYTLLADWDFNLKLWAIRSFLYTNLVIVDFYGGGETTISRTDEKFSRDFSQNCNEYFGYRNKKDGLKQTLLLLLQKFKNLKIF